MTGSFASAGTFDGLNTLIVRPELEVQTNVSSKIAQKLTVFRTCVWAQVIWRQTHVWVEL